MRRRIYCLVVLFVLLLAVLTIRLAAIQFFDGSKYKFLAESQSRATLSGISARGTIYDRNNRPLTDVAESFIFLIEDRRIDDGAEALLQSMNARFVESGNDKYRIYTVPVIDKKVIKILCKDYGALAVKSRQRYSESQPAVHLIGYVNGPDQPGVCGIEKDFDSVLSAGQKTFTVKNDGQGYIIPGTGIRIEDAGREWGVLTTLDLDVQNTVEKALFDCGKSGAVVITHIPSGEILASASTPGYNPYRIEEYINGDGSELLNKATSCMYPPGSLFRVILAAAALEKGIVTKDTGFTCSGSIETEGIRVKCPSGGSGGHGEIRFCDAMARSCNALWAQVSLKTGAKTILETAQAFGFGEEAVDLLSGQAKGNLPSLEEAPGADIVNLSSGREHLSITPMQAARMTRIIASGGWDSPLSVIRGTVEGVKGAALLPKLQGRQVISPETARIIGEMMREAAKETGDDFLTAAGIGAQGWYTGYIPADDPLYGITVLLEEETAGGETAALLFDELASSLY
jgi:penicillin-binding protein 2